MRRRVTVVGVRQPDDRLWVNFGKVLRGRFRAPPPSSSPGREDRAKRKLAWSKSSSARLRRAFQEEDGQK